MGRLGGLLERKVLRNWEKKLSEAEALDRAELKSIRSQARALSSRLGHITHAADARLLARAAIPRPLHTDWAWRPELWTGPVAAASAAPAASGTALGREAKLFYDAPGGECAVRQLRNAAPDDTAPFGIAIDVFHFDGSFLSLAIDLPEEGCQGLAKSRILRLGFNIETECPLQVFARLNLRHGPNVATATQRLDAADHVDFDLSGIDFEETRVASAWIDLIFEAPAMNRIRVGNVTLTRRPRATF